jgi:alpha-beta hydrolase superfamily lysophospholipase
MKTQLKTPFGKANFYSVEASSDSSLGRILVVPGFSETITQSSRLVDSFAKQGFDATTFSQPRRRGNKANRKSTAIDRQAALVAGFVDQMTSGVENKKINLVAHSLGAAAVLRAAQLSPDKIESITLLEPVGMTEPQGLGKIMKKAGKKNLRNQKNAESIAVSIPGETKGSIKKLLTKSQIGATALVARNFRLATRESIEAAKYSINADAEAVTALGIPVHVIRAQSDELFPQEQADATYGLDGHMTDGQTVAVDGLFSSYSVMSDPEAGHDTSWLRPEATAIAASNVLGHAALAAMNAHVSQV